MKLNSLLEGMGEHEQNMIQNIGTDLERWGVIW